MGLNTFRYQFVVPLDPPQTDPSKFEADEDERGTERTIKKNLILIHLYFLVNFNSFVFLFLCLYLCSLFKKKMPLPLEMPTPSLRVDGIPSGPPT